MRGRNGQKPLGHWIKRSTTMPLTCFPTEYLSFAHSVTPIIPKFSWLFFYFHSLVPLSFLSSNLLNIRSHLNSFILHFCQSTQDNFPQRVTQTGNCRGYTRHVETCVLSPRHLHEFYPSPSVHRQNTWPFHGRKYILLKASLYIWNKNARSMINQFDAHSNQNQYQINQLQMLPASKWLPYIW